MANNGEIDVGFGLDTSQAGAELRKLQAQLQGITGNLVHTQATIENRIAAMTADLTRAMTQLKAGSDQMLRTQRRLDATGGQQLGAAARGGRSSQVADAAARSIIADAKAESTQVVARITNELVSQFSQRLKAMDGMVAARLRAETYRSTKFQASNSPEMLAAKQILDQRRSADTLFEAQHGRGAAANRATLDRLGSNGGADILAVQSKLLIGYQALSVAMNSLRGLSTFVVQLDQEMKNFQAITATTNSEMTTLRVKLIEASEATKFTALEIAQAATIMGQAGFSAREVADSIQSISTLATAAGTDLSQAVDVVTSAMSIFNLQTSEAVNVSNTLTSALNLSKLTIDKIALGLQYSGQTAAQMGIGFSELTASLGALSNSGIRSGSTLGTGLRQLLIDLQTPSAKFVKILKELKLSQEDVSVESQGLLPVLATLREAGFGASQAFESLEVRAASAYLSLSANTDLASDLQRQFLLSNAAAEANDIQMSSLANTFSRFQSVVGTVASTALEPFLAVMQRTLSAVSDALAVLNDYPAVLGIVGIGITAVATAITARLVIGLVRAIPLMLGMSAGLTTMGGAAAASTGALGLLLNLFRVGNPLVLALSLISALAVGFELFGKNADSAADRVDVLKGRVNQLGGEADTTQGQIEAIDAAVTNLIRQKETLDANPVMREARILELTQQFHDLAGSVSTSTSTVDDLIRALRELRNIDLKQLSSDLGASVAADEALIAGQKTLLQEQHRSASEQFPLADVNPEAVIQAFAEQLGPQMAGYVRLALDKSLAFPTDAAEAGFIGNNISTKLSELTTQSELLNSKQRLGSLTPAEVETLARIPEQIAMVEALKAAIDPMVETTKSIASTEFDKSLKIAQRLAADVKSSPEFQGLTREAESYLQEFSARSREIGSGASEKSAAELTEAYRALSMDIEQRIQGLNDRTTAVVSKVAAGLGADPDDVRGVALDLSSPLAGLRADLKTKFETNQDLLAKLIDDQLNNQIDTIDQEISATKGNARNAVTQQEIDSIEDFILRRFDQKRRLTKEIFDAQFGAAEDDDERLKLRQEFEEKQRQINVSEQDAVGDLGQQSLDLRVREIEREKTAIDQDITATETKLRDLLTAMSKVSPGAAFDALKVQFETLAAALGQMQLQSGSLGINADSATQIGRTQSDRASFSMDYLMKNGNLTQAQAAGLVGRLLVESGLDVNAIGDRGQARGIAQHHPDRQANFKGDWGSITDQLDFILWELNNTEAAAGAMLRAAQTPTQAANAAMAYERPGGYQPGSPETGNGYLNTVRYANTLAQGDFATNIADGKGTAADLAAKEYEVTLKGIKASSAQSVKAAQQQIETLITQSKGLNDPKLIEQITASVNAQYKKIIEAKVTAFDAENPNAKSDPELTAQREDLIKGLQADQNQKISQLLNTYWETLDRNLQLPVTNAQLTVDAASRAGNDNNFTGQQLTDLANNVEIAERTRLVEREVAAKQVLLQVQQQLAVAEATGGDVAFWRNEEAAAIERVAEATREKNAQDQAAAAQGPSVQAAIQSATQAWLQQQGVIDQFGDMIPLAKQVEDVWGGVLDGLQNGFSTLFLDLTSGTMSAGEAFKKFGVSVLDVFSQIIAKKLATQVVMSLMGDGTGGGGDIWSALFGTPGMSLGGTVKGAALGERITGGVPGRDSVLRRLMPGEVVLRQSAASAIGTGTLESLNNLGNRTLSNGLPPMPSNDNGGGGVLNVWVVTPDQMPSSMGPSDVIATVADNLGRRGSLKQLVKQIALGQI